MSAQNEKRHWFELQGESLETARSLMELMNIAGNSPVALRGIQDKLCLRTSVSQNGNMALPELYRTLSGQFYLSSPVDEKSGEFFIPEGAQEITSAQRIHELQQQFKVAHSKVCTNQDEIRKIVTGLLGVKEKTFKAPIFRAA